MKARLWDRPLRRLASALTNIGGASAVEFALIVPLVIALYAGSVNIGNLLTISRRSGEVASTAADLTAQVKTVCTRDLADITAAATSILSCDSVNCDPTLLKIVLTSVVADANNSPKVAWSYAANGGTARAANSDVTLPAGLTQANSSVIMAEVTYAFSPLLNLKGTIGPIDLLSINPGFFDMKRTFYSRPRKSLTVANTDPVCP
jgi:Flp pilus assembly protein TadG